jgi:LytS/YehU family sensor histidine kinase
LIEGTDIERARFERRLRVHIDVPAALKRRVPPLLQPIVENAEEARQRIGGAVTVTARLDTGDGAVPMSRRSR